MIPIALSHFRQVADARHLEFPVGAGRERKSEFHALNAFIVAPFLPLQHAALTLIADIAKTRPAISNQSLQAELGAN